MYVCVYVFQDLSIFWPLCFEFSEFTCLTSAVEDFAQIPLVFMISLVFVRAEGYLEGFDLREGLSFVLIQTEEKYLKEQSVSREFHQYT